MLSCSARLYQGFPLKGKPGGLDHLDLDSKEVLLDALVDYGGTLIFVSHDRYFVERLATKIVEVGGGAATLYPGTYTEFLWHKQARDGHERQEGRDRRDRRDGQERRGGLAGRDGDARRGHAPAPRAVEANKPRASSHQEKKRIDAEVRKRQRADHARQSEVERLEQQIAECERAIKLLEQTMSAPGFYQDRRAAQPTVDEHQALMWKVGDLMHRWEELQTASSPSPKR